MLGASRAFSDRQRALRVEAPDYEQWSVVAVNGDGTVRIARPGWTTNKYIDNIPVRGGVAPAVKDSVLVSFQDGKRNRPQVVAISSMLSILTQQSPAVEPPFLSGVWPQSRGGPSLSMLSPTEQIPPDLNGSSYSWATLGPINPSFPPLSICCPEIDGHLRFAVYWPKSVSGELQLTLTLIDPAGPIAWESAIGDPIAAPSGVDGLTGLRMGWMEWDQQYQRFWLTGWGTSDRRKTLYCVDASGNQLGALSTGAHLVQSSVGAGAFVKGWHSRRPPTYRQAPDDELIRAYYRNPSGAIAQHWTLDPQAILPGYQIATSSAGNPFASTANPEGAWPIDAERRQILIWVSGTKKLGNNNDATMIQMHPEASGGALVLDQPDDSKTKEHKASLVSVNVDSGAVKWRRDFSYIASGYTVDSSSVLATELLLGAVVGSDIGGLAMRGYFPVSTAAWSTLAVYRGLAVEDSIPVSPIDGVTFPGCTAETGTPVYSEYTVPIVPWIGPAWGGGGVYDSPSVHGSFRGPKYSWFAPGHVCLCPLPGYLLSPDSGPQFGWPEDDPTIARLDPVGGVLNIDSTGNAFGAHVHQSQPIVVGRNDGQADWQGHTETFVDAVLPDTQCGQWINARLHWDCYMVGLVRHNMVLRLHRTGPNGEPLGDEDISQYFSQPSSDIQWSARANVWQIVVLVERGRVLVVRDYYYSAIDSGNLEDRPYLAIEIRDRDALGTVHGLVPLLEEWADTYLDESDPEEPVTLRVWDQYSNADTATLGKGAAYQDGSWVLWRHLVYNRQSDQIYCNECLISWPESGMVVSRRLTAIGEVGRPESPDSLGTLALAGAQQIWAPSTNISGAWPVMVRSNS